MKKLVFVLFIIFSIQNVSANHFSEISVQELEFTNMEIASFIDANVCFPYPSLCSNGKIDAFAPKNIIDEVGIASVEAANSILVNNQIIKYLEQGTVITDSLQINESGDLLVGALQFNENKEEFFGNLISREIDNLDVFGKGIKFEKLFTISTIIFSGNNSRVSIMNNIFNNIRPENTFCFKCEENNIQKNNFAFIKLDNNGEVIEADFVTNDNGGTYNFGNDRVSVPPNSRIIFKEKEVDIDIAKSGEIECPSFLDSLLLQNQDYIGNVIELEGENVTISCGGNFGVLQEGIVNIKNGDFYIPKGKSAIINNVGITSPGSENVNLYFDGLEHANSETYISMNPDKGMLVTNVGPLVERDYKNINLRFLRNNPFIDIEENDLFSVNIRDGSSLLLQTRNEQGLVPEIIVTPGLFEEEITNGKIHLFLSEDRIDSVQSALAESGESSPVEIIVEGFDEKYIINNYNEFASVPLDFTGATEIIGGFSKFDISDRLIPRLYSSDNFLSELNDRGINIVGGPGSEFEGMDPREFLTKEQLSAINSHINRIPDESLAVESIRIYPNDYWDERNENSAGYALREESVFALPLRSLNQDISGLIFHENTHLFHESKRGSAWENLWLKLDGSYEKDEGTRIVGATQGAFYRNFYSLFPSLSPNLFSTWDDETREPRYGKVTSYAENNIYEDVAETSEEILRSLQENSLVPYWDLIYTKSDFYRERQGRTYETGTMDRGMALKWADIYLGKLSLAKIGGFITPTQYSQIYDQLSPEIRKLVKQREAIILQNIGY